jgi:hypothetical protein
MQGIELIVVRMSVLQPVPLHHGSFEQTGRRIGVVLQQLGCISGKCQIKAAIQTGFLVTSALGDEPPILDRDSDISERCAAHHMVNRIQADND